VRISPINSDLDQWSSLQGDALLPLELSQKSKDRFLNHFKSLKTKLQIKGSFLVESANNFPADCGLASSASSFAALTQAAQELAIQQGQQRLEIQELAELSRQGSGSSARSFFEPWALWYSEGIRPLELPLGGLLHMVVVVEKSKKKVSSSEAHRRVSSSALYVGRRERAENRLAQLIQVFRDDPYRKDQWQEAFEICWAEFWDMHALFETSHPAFGYMEPGSLEVLTAIRKYWSEHNDGPLVTMDAGANVHFLFRPDQQDIAQQLKKEFLKKWMVFISGKEIT
jgi:diphosphomevalonate decarboxylase